MTLKLKTKKEVINAITQTEIDTSLDSEVSPEHILSTSDEFFINPENISNQSATHYFLLEIDDEVEFSSVNKDFSHVNYAQTGYLSSYTATHAAKDLSRILTKLFHDSIRPISMIPLPH